ncbi:hypothetical protein ACWNXI_09035 [Caldibacillus thermoamylovorans]
MHRIRNSRYMQFIAAPLFALSVLYLAVRKHGYALEHTSVLLSLTIVFPLYLAVVYRMTIGRIKRSWKACVSVAAFGLVIVYVIIPPPLREQYRFIKYVFFVIESLFIVIELWIAWSIIGNLRAFIRTFRVKKTKHFYFLSTYAHTIEAVFRRPVFLLRIMITEIAALYYLTYRKKRCHLPLPYPTYSYHKKTEYFGVFLMLVHAMLIEIVGVHWLVMQWSEVAAWTVTFFDVYFLLVLIADYRAITLSPIILAPDRIHIQLGIRSFVELEYANMEAITRDVTPKPKRKKETDTYSVALLGFFDEEPKLEIRLRQPVEVIGLLGRKNTVRKLYVTVDDAHGFYETVSENWKRVLQGK